MNRACTGQ